MRRILGIIIVLMVAYPLLFTTHLHITRQITPDMHQPEHPLVPNTEIDTHITVNHPSETSKQPEKPSEEPKQHKRTVTICNNIKKSMISYRKYCMSYTPDFALLIQGNEIKPGEQKEITIVNNMIELSYRYNFLNGYKKGKKTVIFALSPENDQFGVTFSWQSDWRLQVTHADARSVHLIY